VEDPEKLQRDLQYDIQAMLPELQSSMLSGKMKERQILAESVAAGGPSSVQEAILNMMDVCKIGVRQLAYLVNVKRNKLQKMIDGRINIPPEVISSLYDVFKSRRPDLFED
jgi:hypothetical protein